MPIYKPVNHDFFKTWSSEMAYLLGYIAADGAIVIGRRGNYYLSVDSIDRELIEFLQTHIAPTHKISLKHVNHPRWKPINVIQIGSKVMINDLIELGMTPRKSARLQMPVVPARFVRDFIRGYFDGDGNVFYAWYKRIDRSSSRHCKQVVFTSSSRGMLVSVQNELDYLGVHDGRLLKRGNYYCLVYSRMASFCELFKIFYAHKPTLYLKRKFLYFKQALKKLNGTVV